MSVFRKGTQARILAFSRLCQKLNKRTVMEDNTSKIQIRPLQMDDYTQLAQSFKRVYADGSDVFWTRKQIETLLRLFPEGQIVTVQFWNVLFPIFHYIFNI